VLPRAEQLPSGLSDHSVTQGSDIVPRNLDGFHVEEADIRRRFAGYFLHDAESVRALHLVSVDLSAPLVDGRSLVPFGLGLVTAGLDVIVHPVRGGGPSDKIELVLVQIEENRIADYVAVVVACDELLGLVDLEILERIYTQVGEHSQRVGTLHV